MWASKYKGHYQKNLAIAFPIILSQAGQMVTGIVDNAMVGQVSTASLAASSFANGVFSNLLIFGMGFSFGLTPLVGSSFGSKQQGRIGNLFSHSLLLNTGLGILLFVALLGFGPFMRYLNQPVEVVELAIPYFYVISLSLIPFMVFFSCKQFQEGLSVTKPAMFFTLTSNVLNIVLNYVLIYGKLGFEPMGLMGAGWATLISRIYMAAGIMLYTVKAEKFQAYFQVGMLSGPFSWASFRELTRLGFPIAIQFSFEVAAFSIGTIMMGWVGTRELAAHQIVLSIASLTYMIASGLGAATTVRVSNLYGEGKFGEMRMAAMASQHIVVLFMSTCALLFVLFRNTLPILFSTDPGVIAVAGTLMFYAAMFQVFDGIQVNAIGALRGIADVKVPAFLAFVAYWVLSLPVGYLTAFVFGFGAIGIWVGFSVGLGVASILLVYRFQRASTRIQQQGSALTVTAP
jgi:MATE family multidrug resistance protein